METTNKNLSALRHDAENVKAHVGEAASDLLNEGKKLASELYSEGLNKVNEAEETIKTYSDELLKNVQKNPLTSVLIAAGVGFLLSAILKK